MNGIKKMVTLTIPVISALGFFLPGWAEDAKTDTAEPRAVQIVPDLYLIEGLDGGNVAFLVSEAGVLVVDAGEFPDAGATVVEVIGRTTDRPIRYVVITHYHSDHTYGLQPFPESAVIVGHDNLWTNMTEDAKKMKENVEINFPRHLEGLRKRIETLRAEGSAELAQAEQQLKDNLAYAEAYKTVTLVPPNLTFSDHLTIRLGDHLVRLHYPGTAHTTGNILVAFPNLKAVHMGDLLFHEHFPYIDHPMGCDTETWLRILKDVAAWDVEHVIPGHGALTDKSGLTKLASYFTDLRTAVIDAVHQGKTLADMQKSISLPQYKDWDWPAILPDNIEAVHKELQSKSPQK